MLKTEMLKVSDFNYHNTSKTMLLRYTAAIQAGKSRPYDEAVLKLIHSIKGIPDFNHIEVNYESVDFHIRQKPQKIMIKINEKIFYTFLSDTDLDLFTNFLSLFKFYELEVETYEETVPKEMLIQIAR